MDASAAAGSAPSGRGRRRRAGAVALAAATAVLGLISCGAGANLCSDSAAGGAAPDAASAPFRSAIPLGAAVRWDRVRDSPGYASFYLSHYSWLTPENELKTESLEPERGAFDFGRADAIVGWALRHGKQVHGHVLVWGTQLPHWVLKLRERKPTPSRAAKTRQAMTEYITTVIRHFRGRIGEWDVVNEAFNADGSYVRNVWYRELGPGYIEDAFRAARAADPTVRLCYNDLGPELPGPHADAVLALVGRLSRLGLLDCVGFELHTAVPGPDRKLLVRQLQGFAATGAELLISELDVVSRTPATATESESARRQAQATVYANVARACRAGSRCDRITTWGFTDASSWLGSASEALPFDSSCRAKPAWAALRSVLDARTPATTTPYPPATARRAAR
jgi:endo-1,4-beta-xylanase